MAIDIYRKPTTTNTTINFLSNHPLEQKLAAYRLLISRMLTLPLKKEQRQEEWKKILQIVHNNNSPSNLLIRLKQRIQQRATQPQPPTTTGIDAHWATFTYTSPQIRKITNLFKPTNKKIAFKCNNTISQLSKPVTKTLAPTSHDRSGIYSLTRNTCKQAYVGQTSWGFKLRYQEHTLYIKTITRNLHTLSLSFTTCMNMDRWTKQ